jgi:predicted nucleic acid-binding protein
MISRLFWDTSGFYALLNSDDNLHQSALNELKQAKKDKTYSITTDWVVGETCTLLMARKRGHIIHKFLNIINSSSVLERVFVSKDQILKAENMMQKYVENSYSYVDCISFTIMKQLKIRRAVTSDHHFKEQGFELV